MHRREMVLGENRSNASFKYTRKSVYINISDVFIQHIALI